MSLIKIETREGSKILKSFINSEYIERIDERFDGSTEILLESGDTYVTNKSIYDIKKLIDGVDKDTQTFQQWFPTTRSSFDNIPDVCRNCSNHPSNGGSGICHCTLGGSYTVTC